MAQEAKKSKETIDRKKENNVNHDKTDPSKTMPSCDPNEGWVREHIRKSGEEPGFF